MSATLNAAAAELYLKVKSVKCTRPTDRPVVRTPKPHIWPVKPRLMLLHYRWVKKLAIVHYTLTHLEKNGQKFITHNIHKPRASADIDIHLVPHNEGNMEWDLLYILGI